MLHAERVIFTAARNRYFLLPRQESNLNSSDPESDVLPVTPRGKQLINYLSSKSSMEI